MSDFSSHQVLGVYSRIRNTEVGLGDTAQNYTQKTYWYVRLADDDTYEIRPLNINHMPSGIVSYIGKKEFLEEFNPELDYYQKKNLSYLQSLNKKLQKGKSSFEEGNLEAVEQIFCKAILTDELNSNSDSGLGIIFCIKKEYHKLKEIVDILLFKDVNFMEEQRRQFSAFGTNLRKENKHDIALSFYKKALEINPDDENLHFNISRVYFDMQDLENCITHLQQALEINPGFVEAKKFLNYCNRIYSTSELDYI